MKINKLMMGYLLLFLAFSGANILVCFDILPFKVWRITLLIAILLSTMISFYSNKTKDNSFTLSDKDKKEKIICISVLVIWGITLFTTLFLKK